MSNKCSEVKSAISNYTSTFTVLRYNIEILVFTTTIVFPWYATLNFYIAESNIVLFTPLQVDSVIVIHTCVYIFIYKIQQIN